jgi:hypothetical protein
VEISKKIYSGNGLKTTITGFKNNTDYFTVAGAERTKDEIRTSSYNYRERLMRDIYRLLKLYLE